MLMVWLQIIAVFGIAVLLINQKIFHIISRISTIHPMPLILGLIGGCILLITITTSFHSDVFSENDRYHEKLNSYGSKRNAYEWLNLVDVFRFPINQLLINEYFKTDNTFDFANKSNDSSYVLLIVDKTLSTFEDNKANDKFQAAKRELIDRVRAIDKRADNEITELSQFSDLLSIAIATSVLERRKVNLSVDLFYGRYAQQAVTMLHTDEFSNGKNSIIDFIEQYNQRISKIKPNDIQRNISNFSSLFEYINKYSLKDDKITNKKVNIIIVSDFDDDSQNNDKSVDLYDSFKAKLSVLQQRTHIESIDVFQLKSNSNKSLDVPSKMIACFSNVFNKRTYVQSTDCDETLINNTNLHFDDAITKSDFSLSDGPVIDAFYYSDNINNLRNAFTSIYFYDSNIQNVKELRICLKSRKDRNIDSTVKAFINNNSTNLQLDKPVTLKGITQKLDIEFPQEMVGQDHFYLDIMQTGNTVHKIQAPIVFKQQLTRTSSEILIFLYSMLFSTSMAYVLVLLCGLFIFSWKVNGYNKVQPINHKWIGWPNNSQLLVVAIIIFLCIISYVYCIFEGAKYFHSAMSSDFKNSIFIIFLCSFVLPIAYTFFLIYGNFSYLKKGINILFANENKPTIQYEE
jgi:hypothetical protein